LRRLGAALLGGVVGYVGGAVVGYFLVLWFSGNVHDRELEAAMTAAFFFGPAVALAGVIAGGLAAGTRRGARSR